MRILLVAPWDQEFGGVASVVGNLARYLQNQGHEVSFLYPAETPLLKLKVTKWGFPGFQLRMQLPANKYYIVGRLAFLLLFPFTTYQLIRFIQKERIQIINIHYSLDNFFYFALCRWFLPIKLVTSVHGADIFPEGRPRSKYSWTLKFLFRMSDLIVANSRAFRGDFLSVFPDLREKAIVIHNSVNLAELNGLVQHETRGNQEYYILCVATHNEKKAVDVLIHAAACLAKEDPLFKLVLVGDGPLRGQLEELAVALGVRERIEFLGWQGRTAVVQLLHGCEAFVLPSRSEPFGIAIIEALACRKPVVATKVGGIPEIIEDGKNGLLVEPDNPMALAEALRRVLKDQELRKVIAKNGYMTVQKHFCCEHTGTAYEAIFDDLLGSLPRRDMHLQ